MILVALVLLFLVLHLALDMRMLVHSIRHPQDALLTLATIIVLVVHLVLDYTS